MKADIAKQFTSKDEKSPYSLKIHTRFIILFFLIGVLLSCNRVKENPFWADGKEFFELHQIFSDERMPNIVVTASGTVLAVWGDVRRYQGDDSTYYNVRLRRSEDGGKTWGQQIGIGRGVNGGGVTVDEHSGNIFVFVEKSHDKRLKPPALVVYRSYDDGKTWEEHEVRIKADANGNVPSMSMSERGITLLNGKYAGRLLRPARVFEGGERSKGYNTAIYSDDGGNTWHSSAPFPAEGTGEGALEELSDGRIYYNSRRHWAPEGENPRMRWIAWSYDGGETWEDLSVSEELPDGAQHRDYGLMGGLVRLPLDDHDILLFSNIESSEGRQNGTVWASFDGGQTWPVKRLVEKGNFAYSSMAAGSEGTPSEGLIYLFYEGDTQIIAGQTSGAAYVACFNLAWVTGGRDWKNFLKN